jgi:peptidoglycan/LPS O-acetylase OafA/YrhL
VRTLSEKDFLDSNALGRSVAILLVVLCHVPATGDFWTMLGPFMTSGKLAVSLFVFYSGLLLEYQSKRAGQAFAIRPWLMKRFLRIYPTYWVGLLLTLFVGIVFNGKTYDILTILANLSGMHLLMGSRVISSGYGSPYWFISLILVCYILFIFFHRVQLKELLIVGAMSLSLAGLYTRYGHYLSILAFTPFFLGMFISDYLRKGRSIPGGFAAHFAMTFFLLCILVFVYKHHHFIQIRYNLEVYVEMLGCVCLTVIPVSLAFCIACTFRWLRENLPGFLNMLLCIGNVSFAIYCLHEPMLVLVEKVSSAGHPIIGLFVYGIVVGLISWALTVVANRISTNFRFRQAGIGSVGWENRQSHL